MTRKRLLLVVGGAVVLLLVVSMTMCGGGVEVEVAEVRRDTLRVMVEEEGRTRVRESFVIAAPVTGRLQRIDLEEGITVSAGEVLARLAPAPEDPRSQSVTRAQVEAADARRVQVAAELARAEAAADQAAREVERRVGLAEAGALSREQMEQARLQATTLQRQAEAARAALLAAEADVAALRASLQGAGVNDAGPVVSVTAPAAGSVLRVLEESERVVTAGTPLLELGNSEGLEVVVDVLSEDAVRVRPGNGVMIGQWGGERPLWGRVRLVEPAAFTEVSALGVEEQRVNVIADLLDTPPELGAGFRVEAGIVVWEGENVLVVPTSALFQQDGGWRVFAVEGGRARVREVELGQRGVDAAEVRSGVEEGEEVVLFPSDELEDGVRITARR